MNDCKQRTGEFKWEQKEQIQIEWTQKEGIAFANGCEGRSCPCRTWIQCYRYNNWKYKQDCNDEHITIINEWYKNHFKLRYDCPEAFPNG